MSRIRGRGNKETEVALAKLLRASGVTGWRRHAKVLGCPDFSFHKERVAVFVDGCFWHCCPKHSNMPSNNRAFWKAKLGKNRLRDLEVNRALRQKGWRVVRIWEHDLAKRPERCVARVLRVLARL